MSVSRKVEEFDDSDETSRILEEISCELPERMERGLRVLEETLELLRQIKEEEERSRKGSNSHNH